MTPLVAIEVPIGEPPAEVATMVEACTAALAEGRCVVADTETQTPTALAVVSWLAGDHLKARVEVGQRTSSRSSVSWHRRDLTFTSADSVAERWTSVGYTIATIVGEIAESAPEPGAAPKNSTAGKQVAGSATNDTARASGAGEAPRAAEASPVRWADLELLVSLDSERSALGAGLALGSRIKGPLGAEFATGYATSARDDQGLAVSRWSLAGYLGLVGEASRVHWRLMLGPLLTRLGSDVSRGEESDAGARWLPGISIRISAGYALSERIALVALTSAEQLSGATELRVRRRSVSRIPAQSLTLGVGVGIRF